MSEHEKIKNIDNTENLDGKLKAGKTKEKREFTILYGKNYSDSRVWCDYKCSRVTLFLPLFLLEQKGYLYFW